MLVLEQKKINMLVLKNVSLSKKKSNYLCVKLSHMNPLQTIIEQAWETELCFKKKQQLTVSEKLLT
jgi:hypothetical protein